MEDHEAVASRCPLLFHCLLLYVNLQDAFSKLQELLKDRPNLPDHCVPSVQPSKYIRLVCVDLNSNSFGG